VFRGSFTVSTEETPAHVYRWANPNSIAFTCGLLFLE
jgi:hypothetical protein